MLQYEPHPKRQNKDRMARSNNLIGQWMDKWGQIGINWHLNRAAIIVICPYLSHLNCLTHVSVYFFTRPCQICQVKHQLVPYQLLVRFKMPKIWPNTSGNTSGNTTYSALCLEISLLTSNQWFKWVVVVNWIVSNLNK